MKFNKERRRKRIQRRIRKRVQGTADRPRLAVYRSNKGIYCQLIDDVNGVTLSSASSRQLSSSDSMSKIDQAKEVGKLMADKMKSLKLDTVVFDRAGYLYHGRVKALADQVREAGVTF